MRVGQGRLVEKRYFTNLLAYDSGNGTPAETTEFTYDALGREVEVTKSVGVTTVEQASTSYDAEGRVASIESLQGVIAYEYDALGRVVRTRAALPDAPSVVIADTRYQYDALSRLESVKVYERGGESFPLPKLTSYEYDLTGNLDLQTQENGVIVDFLYDDLGRVCHSAR